MFGLKSATASPSKWKRISVISIKTCAKTVFFNIRLFSEPLISSALDLSGIGGLKTLNENNQLQAPANNITSG